MCGRFSIATSKEKLSTRFQVRVSKEFVPRYNVAPMSSIPVITSANPNTLQFFKWGLVPNWSLDQSTAINMINARAETITEKIHFKHCIKNQRCLIPADGFFEWKKVGKTKKPMRFTLLDKDLFAFAGLWDRWENKETGESLNTCTILTTQANKLVAPTHDRMPVILRKDLERLWIAEDINDMQVQSLLKPFDHSQMYSYEVHRDINHVKNDSPLCIEPAPQIYPGENFSLFGA
jgi:putative SOS response-associated peptidase YedK